MGTSKEIIKSMLPDFRYVIRPKPSAKPGYEHLYGTVFWTSIICFFSLCFVVKVTPSHPDEFKRRTVTGTLGYFKARKPGEPRQACLVVSNGNDPFRIGLSCSASAFWVHGHCNIPLDKEGKIGKVRQFLVPSIWSKDGRWLVEHLEVNNESTLNLLETDKLSSWRGLNMGHFVPFSVFVAMFAWVCLVIINLFPPRVRNLRPK